MRKIFTHKLLKLVLLLSFVTIYQVFPQLVYAQAGGVADGETGNTNPKNRDNTVTATVPDIEVPTVPILISPTDGELLNDSTPSFIWQESTDNVGVSYYELYIDGSLSFGSIPTTSITTSEFTLTYDNGSGKYTLVPSSGISNGSHNWQILVYDAANNYNSSVIWDFTIDTQAPNYTITSIGPVSTGISSSDISSVPTNPIELEDNEPEFIGTGESNSSVQVTVQIPDESTQTINFTIDGSGNWSFQLGILPRDKDITLNFVITDQAGNVSIITDLKIKIIQEYIAFPPTPTPTPTPSHTPTPSPGTTPTPTSVATPIVTPSPSPPTAQAPSPILKIPVLPPKEFVEIVKKDLVKAVPEPIVTVVSIIPQEIRQVVKKVTDSVAPVGVLVASTAIPAFSFLTLLLQFGQQFSWNIIVKILQALGLIPPKEPQGMVFDSQTNEPVSFAMITITSTSDTISEKIIETVVTDVDGIYQGIQLPVGKYIISVKHQDYNFPTAKGKPGYLSFQEFYRGEEFTVSSPKRQQLFLIPVDKNSEAIKQNQIGKTVRILIRKLRFTNIFWPLLIFSILITLFYPTLINFIVLGIYFIILFKRMVKYFKRPTISGYVKTVIQEPVENATVRISDPNKGELIAIVNTNKQGYYEAFLEPGRYQMQITKYGLVWQRDGGSLSLEEVDVSQETKVVDATLIDVGTIYKQLFGELR